MRASTISAGVRPLFRAARMCRPQLGRTAEHRQNGDRGRGCASEIEPGPLPDLAEEELSLCAEGRARSGRSRSARTARHLCARTSSGVRRDRAGGALRSWPCAVSISSFPQVTPPHLSNQICNRDGVNLTVETCVECGNIFRRLDARRFRRANVRRGVVSGATTKRSECWAAWADAFAGQPRVGPVVPVRSHVHEVRNGR